MAKQEEKVVNQYAQAILAYADEHGVQADIIADLTAIRSVVDAEPDLTALLTAQTISDAEQNELVDALTHGAENAVVNLVKVLLAHHHFAYLTAVVNRFFDLYQQSQGIEAVTITTAVAVDDDQKDRLSNAFQKHSGAKQIQATFEVNTDLIGGVVMQSKSLLIDGSLQKKIAKIRAELLG
ncbi:ATP synthase F1 subunit delta [Fructobacillus ficulneus]|uniref:ATP synthase subunit delta n=1 Tax=Fructobacillus ficulneus TaxID=157463 RepID=A0A0K8MG35_9LACO|nr:ATP synthase F1 subunit delta [Fructobacillus ficulneus]GAO99168.1 ATP synthase subunit delta [Fructobacillus ficulneus]